MYKETLKQRMWMLPNLKKKVNKAFNMFKLCLNCSVGSLRCLSEDLYNKL